MTVREPDYDAFDKIEYPEDPDISPAARRMLAALRDLQTPRRLLRPGATRHARGVLLAFDDARRTASDGLAYFADDLRPGAEWVFFGPLGWRGLDEMQQLHFQEIGPLRPLVFFGDDGGEPFAVIVSPPPKGSGRTAYWISQWTLHRGAAVATAACCVDFTETGHVSWLMVEDVAETSPPATGAAQSLSDMREALNLVNFAGALIFVARHSGVASCLDGGRPFQKLR